MKQHTYVFFEKVIIEFPLLSMYSKGEGRFINEKNFTSITNSRAWHYPCSM